MTITLGGKELTSPSTETARLSMLLWGSSGCGKTTLFGTFPGKKLLINFDTDGQNALSGDNDTLVLDYSKEPDGAVEKFKEQNPLGLDKFLTEHPEIQSVGIDSLTTFGNKALQHGVKIARSTAKGKFSTIEDPGYSGFGNKNTWTQLLVKNILEVTGKHNRHVCFIAHEDKPTTDTNGAVLYISIMLGSSLNQQVPVNISEIWRLSDNGKERRIAIRPCRGYKPMKTRMFLTTEGPEFIWNYDRETREGNTMAEWIDRWTSQGDKLPLPTGTERTKVGKTSKRS